MYFTYSYQSSRKLKKCINTFSQIKIKYWNLEKNESKGEGQKWMALTSSPFRWIIPALLDCCVKANLRVRGKASIWTRSYCELCSALDNSFMNWLMSCVPVGVGFLFCWPVVLLAFRKCCIPRKLGKSFKRKRSNSKLNKIRARFALCKIEGKIHIAHKV